MKCVAIFMIKWFGDAFFLSYRDTAIGEMKKMLAEKSNRLRNLPFYFYSQVRETIGLSDASLELIDLSTGDPTFSTSGDILHALGIAAENPKTHHYNDIKGSLEFRSGIARWLRKRFQVDMDCNSEILAFTGSKEGITLSFLGLTDPGDTVLIPDPGYPTYDQAAAMAGASRFYFRLTPENGYLPDFTAIPETVAKAARVMFLNYPNNPTAATVERDFFNKAVDFAKAYEIIICHDAAYSEITFDGYQAPSLLEAKYAKDLGVEFHSLSKTFCMTGWRVGFAAGNKDLINTLYEAKRVYSSGQFAAIEKAALYALENCGEQVEYRKRVYQERRDYVMRQLAELGLSLEPPKGSFYVWIPIPNKKKSMEFVKELILKARVVVFPGIGYGESGEGYIRIALTQDIQIIKEAFQRIGSFLLA